MPSRRTALVVALLAVLAQGCNRYARHQDPAALSKAPRAYGTNRDPARAGTASASTDATLRVTVVEQDSKRPVVGAQVKARRGKIEHKAPTDASGLATLVVPAGSWAVRVVGCGTEVTVDRASEAGTTVHASQTLALQLVVQDWKRRYRPVNSVLMSEDPPWAIGDRVTLRVRIEDLCEHDVAPRASLSFYRWRGTSNIDVVSRPARAGNDGYAPVTIRCRARGNAGLIVSDPAGKAPSLDVILAGKGPPEGRTTCE